MSVYRVCWVVCLALLGVVGAAAARAESWCSEPIYAHEWGVMVFDGAARRGAWVVPLPSWIEQRASVGPSRDVKPVVTPRARPAVRRRRA